MSTETPVTDGMQRAAIVMKLNYMAKQYTNGAIARGGSLSKHYLEEAADIIKAQEAENARLREDEKGLLQDIQRLTEEAFKRDEELAGQRDLNAQVNEAKLLTQREITYWRERYYRLVTKMQEEGNIPYGN